MRRYVVGLAVVFSCMMLAAASSSARGTEQGPQWEQLGSQPVSLVVATASGELAHAASVESAHPASNSGGAWEPILATPQPDGSVHVASVPGTEGGLVASSNGELYTRRLGGDWVRLARSVKLFTVGGPNGTTIVTHAAGWQGKSDDFGRSWQKLTDPGIKTDWIRMTYGHGALYMASMQGTVVRSEDLGATWETLDDRMLVGYVSDGLSLDPLLADRIYRHLRPTGFFNLVRMGPPRAAGARGEVPLKLARSVDGGKTWLDMPSVYDRTEVAGGYATVVAGSAAPGQVLYAGTFLGSRIGLPEVVRSLDGGRTWEAFGDQSGMGRAVCLATEPSDTHTAYCGASARGGSSARVLVTRDGGRSWVPLGAALDGAGVNDLLVRPGGEAAMYIATDTGVQRLTLPELPPAAAPAASR